MRGIIMRVAANANVHPSFVTLVIDGKRNSPRVTAALVEELKLIGDHLNRLSRGN
jgi:hypothetical protein